MIEEKVDKSIKIVDRLIKIEEKWRKILNRNFLIP